MKYFILMFYLFFFALICSCEQHGRNQPNRGTIDSVDISITNDDTILLSQQFLDSVIMFYPELAEDMIQEPDITYSTRNTTELAIDKGFSFGSEQGQDFYYKIYAYLLNQRPDLKVHNNQRDKLIKIYRNINRIHSKLDEGSPGFDHMYSRIPAYAMYSVDRYNYLKKDFLKSYDITKQRNLYIKAFKQYIDDELAFNMNIKADEKPILKKELFQTVNELDSLITEHFLLNAAQEYQYSQYY